MKVLLATKDGQGGRENDFCFCEEGELVSFPLMECANESLDGHCGCRRSLAGLTSGKGTTTFKVVELDIELQQYVWEMAESIKRAHHMMIEPNPIAVLSPALEMLRAANRFETGTILERRSEIRWREVR